MTSRKRRRAWWGQGATALALCVFASACYTLNGISISPDTETFLVEQFEVNVVEGPAEIGQRFSEALKLRINSDTRLAFDDQDPDVRFTGAIVGFSVTPEAPNANNQADLSRLTITVAVEYDDTILEKNSYRQTFTDFELFNTNENLLDIQDGLLADIFDRMSEEAFQKAFSNW